ncbi:DUF2798 domain-containing protein [Kaistia geumhonensis]|uniref:DUF2798 domain-containing protein n=1 Tax=Kaistia geumhonensis TaxID=410839 RepID=A0ABU0M620_9HYPH|nr:DUF2798 domain-containing protein [Kaistia geumhonensis]MCX5478366.1 DUF2798 domain-containing protein [Kaistia geumhonensis]MDQ0516416.1 hypothetical protein [Kaistia geumhonensis]
MTTTSVRGTARLPARFHGIVFPFVLSIVMCATVSAVSTAKAIGLSPDFVTRWLGAWLVSWMVAFPVLLLILPLVRRLVGLIVAPPQR